MSAFVVAIPSNYKDSDKNLLSPSNVLMNLIGATKNSQPKLSREFFSILIAEGVLDFLFVV